jgi:hypothetical protein
VILLLRENRRVAFFNVPVNLQHAATIARRIETRLAAGGLDMNSEGDALREAIEELRDRLGPYESGPEPSGEDEAREAAEAAAVGRRIVDEIERLEIGEDRLGQGVRNLFECLGLGEEGAEISLRAGENPNSLMRPV